MLLLYFLVLVHAANAQWLNPQDLTNLSRVAVEEDDGIDTEQDERFGFGNWIRLPNVATVSCSTMTACCKTRCGAAGDTCLTVNGVNVPACTLAAGGGVGAGTACRQSTTCSNCNSFTCMSNTECNTLAGGPICPP